MMKKNLFKIIFLGIFINILILLNFKIFAQNIKKQYIKKPSHQLSYTEKNVKTKKQQKTNNLDTATSKLFTEKLLFPLPKGKLLYEYGDRSPKNLNTIKIKNLGIDIIQTHENHSRIIATANGKVVRIVKLKDRIGEVIVIKHQDFFSVYAHTLPLFNLKKNKFVKKGQTIGSVIPDKNQQRILHFEIWHKKKSVNPMQFFK